MRKLFVILAISTVAAMWLASVSGTLLAGELAAGLLHRTPMDIPCPHSCDRCKKEFCVDRVPVKKCVTGKKKVYNCKVRSEYVAIPETKYRFVTRCVTEKIPCCYCKPVCKGKDCPHCYESEEWKKVGCGTCSNCGGLYCKYCQNKSENIPCKHCGREPGKTYIKVHYRSCVKEPYIVYRQVRKPVCVKQPRYEHVKVSVTKYVCDNCNGRGCGRCRNGGSNCDDGGCDVGGCDVDCDGVAPVEMPAEEDAAPLPPAPTAEASRLPGGSVARQ